MTMAIQSPSVFGEYNEGFRRFLDSFRSEFTYVVEQFTRYAGELQSALLSTAEISVEVASLNTGTTRRLFSLMKDISALKDYFQAIIRSTKGVVDYGTKVIPHIQKQFNENDHYKATETIEIFLTELKERIQVVQKYLDEMKGDRNLAQEEIAKKIEEVGNEYDASTQQLLQKLKNAQWMKIGRSFICYTLGQTVIAMSSGSEGTAVDLGEGIMTFSAQSLLEGVKSFADDLSPDLKEKLQSNASKISSLLTECYQKVTHFDIKINSIISNIDQLHKRSGIIKQKLSTVTVIDEVNIATWLSITGYLEEMLGVLADLQVKVIKNGEVDEVDEEIGKMFKKIKELLD